MSQVPYEKLPDDVKAVAALEGLGVAAEQILDKKNFLGPAHRIGKYWDKKLAVFYGVEDAFGLDAQEITDAQKVKDGRGGDDQKDDAKKGMERYAAIVGGVMITALERLHDKHPEQITKVERLVKESGVSEPYKTAALTMLGELIEEQPTILNTAKELIRRALSETLPKPIAWGVNIVTGPIGNIVAVGSSKFLKKP